MRPELAARLCRPVLTLRNVLAASKRVPPLRATPCRACPTQLSRSATSVAEMGGNGLLSPRLHPQPDAPVILDASVNFGWRAIAAGKDGPQARSRHCLAYDPAGKAVVAPWRHRLESRRRAVGRFVAVSRSSVVASGRPRATTGAAPRGDGSRSRPGIFPILFGGQGKGWIG